MQKESNARQGGEGDRFARAREEYLATSIIGAHLRRSVLSFFFFFLISFINKLQNRLQNKLPSAG